MAARGAGPSRRSHTKSRKGCKTCKRRHIRCDETFPQCRNCTKHQVRCDYMESASSDTEPQSHSPEQPMGSLTPGSAETVNTWQSTGVFPYPELNVQHQPQVNDMSTSEMQLIHHISSLSNALITKSVSAMTIWTNLTPRLLSLASIHPFVMDALHSLSASHMAWVSQSQDIRKLSMHYGSVALGGLHDAIGNFTKANADSALAASIILLSQASDFRSWSSLDAGVSSVISTMIPWKNESAFSDILDTTSAHIAAGNPPRQPMPSPQDRYYILQHVLSALQQMRPFVTTRPLEASWIDQLIDYVQRLQAAEPAVTPEEQFNHIYVLRKWVTWVPVEILEKGPVDTLSLAVIAHCYGTMFALQPLFPDIATRSSAVWVLRPFQEVLQRVTAFHAQGMIHPQEMQTLFGFPQMALDRFHERNPWSRPNMSMQTNAFEQPSLPFSVESSLYPGQDNLSPAFTPSAMYMTPRGSYSSSNATRRSSYLDVPTPQMSTDAHGFTYNTSQWGALPSPGFPSQQYTSEPDSFDFQNEDISYGDVSQGFVKPYEIWT